MLYFPLIYFQYPFLSFSLNIIYCTLCICIPVLTFVYWIELGERHWTLRQARTATVRDTDFGHRLKYETFWLLGLENIEVWLNIWSVHAAIVLPLNGIWLSQQMSHVPSSAINLFKKSDGYCSRVLPSSPLSLDRNTCFYFSPSPLPRQHRVLNVDGMNVLVLAFSREHVTETLCIRFRKYTGQATRFFL